MSQIPILSRPEKAPDDTTKRVFPVGASPSIQDLVNTNQFKIRPLQKERYYLTHGGRDRCLHFINKSNSRELYSFAVGRQMDMAESELLKRTYIAQHPKEWEQVQQIANGKKRGRRARCSGAAENNETPKNPPLIQQPAKEPEKPSTKAESILEPLAIDKDASIWKWIAKCVREQRIFFQEARALDKMLSESGIDPATSVGIGLQIWNSAHQRYYQAQNDIRTVGIPAEQEKRIINETTSESSRQTNANQLEKTLVERIATLESKIDKLAEAITKLVEGISKSNDNDRKDGATCTQEIKQLKEKINDLKQLIIERVPPQTAYRIIANTVFETEMFQKFLGLPLYGDLLREWNASHRYLINKSASLEEKTDGPNTTLKSEPSSIDKLATNDNVHQEEQNLVNVSADKTSKKEQEVMLPSSMVKQMLQEEAKEIAANHFDAASQLLEEAFDELIRASNGEHEVATVIHVLKKLVVSKLSRDAASLRSAAKSSDVNSDSPESKSG
ncbi:MAG: hypothetical protein ABI361_07555 [Nitrososphaera sp.]|jgi:hypothetical protein